MERFISYKKVAIDSITVELDSLSVYFSKQSLIREPAVHRITVAEEGRPDIIAAKYYGNWSYWWVVMVFNDIMDPFEELLAGSVITLPVEEDIILLVNKFKKQNL